MSIYNEVLIPQALSHPNLLAPPVKASECLYPTPLSPHHLQQSLWAQRTHRQHLHRKHPTCISSPLNTMRKVWHIFLTELPNRRSVTYQELEGVLDSSIHHRLLQRTSNQPAEEGKNNFCSLDILQICQKIFSVKSTCREGYFIVRIYCRFVKRVAHCKGRVHVFAGSNSLISTTLGGGLEMRLFKWTSIAYSIASNRNRGTDHQWG